MVSCVECIFGATERKGSYNVEQGIIYDVIMRVIKWVHTESQHVLVYKYLSSKKTTQVIGYFDRKGFTSLGN